MEGSTDTRDVDQKRVEFRKSYSQEHEFQHSSLIDDAKFETAANAEFEKQQMKTELARRFSDIDNDDIEKGNDLCIENYVTKHFSLIFKITGRIGALSKAIKIFEASKARILHIESRTVEHSGKLSEIIRMMEQSGFVSKIQKVREEQLKQDVEWFPRHVSDLDKCTHLVTKFEPELDNEHPGFSDKQYRQRRQEIANIAFNYKYGQAIPRVEYTDEETATWRLVYTKLKELHESHAHEKYIKVFTLLEKSGLYSPEFIPQLEDVSNFMKDLTGFTFRPVSGLLSARDFLASLAFRVFQCTQYIRHPSRPEYSPEPDAIHELLGHVPMLSDPNFAQFSQELGLISLGVSDEHIERLATLYWFTVEFGLCRQGHDIRAIGAGLLSAFGELKHALTSTPELRPFEPEKTALQEYQDQTFQPIYFLADSLESMTSELRRYAMKMGRPFGINFDPYTQTVHVLNNRRAIQVTMKNLELQLAQLQTLYENIH